MAITNDTGLVASRLAVVVPDDDGIAVVTRVYAIGRLALVSAESASAKCEPMMRF